jgi:hypothetical protein
MHHKRQKEAKKLREASTHDANSGQDCVQARNKKTNEKSYVGDNW